jgi:NAD(P)-dependent dehydrogenase (short-subunit alcohol dehydrogenase family)
LFDRAGLPPAARQAFAGHADLLRAVHGDVTDRQSIADVVAGGYHAIVLEAAITGGPARDAADAESILQVNVLAPIPILLAARRRGVARIVNLSSAAAYGAAGSRHALRDEAAACDPDSLYAITNDCLWRKAAVRCLRPIRTSQELIGSQSSARGGRLPALLTNLPFGPSAECLFAVGTRAARCLRFCETDPPREGCFFIWKRLPSY